MARIDTLGRRLAELERQMHATKAPEVVADALEKLGCTIHRPVYGGMVVVDEMESDPPDLPARRDAKLVELDAQGHSDVLVVILRLIPPPDPDDFYWHAVPTHPVSTVFTGEAGARAVSGKLGELARSEHRRQHRGEQDNRKH